MTAKTAPKRDILRFSVKHPGISTTDPAVWTVDYYQALQAEFEPQAAEFDRLAAERKDYLEQLLLKIASVIDLLDDGWEDGPDFTNPLNDKIIYLSARAFYLPELVKRAEDRASQAHTKLRTVQKCLNARQYRDEMAAQEAEADAERQAKKAAEALDRAQRRAPAEALATKQEAKRQAKLKAAQQQRQDALKWAQTEDNS